jgi:hypothetical protein
VKNKYGQVKYRRDLRFQRNNEGKFSQDRIRRRPRRTGLGVISQLGLRRLVSQKNRTTSSRGPLRRRGRFTSKVAKNRPSRPQRVLAKYCVPKRYGKAQPKGKMARSLLGADVHINVWRRHCKCAIEWAPSFERIDELIAFVVADPSQGKIKPDRVKQRNV